MQYIFEPAFWSQLGDYKLHTLALSDEPHDIAGYYNPYHSYQSPVMYLDAQHEGYRWSGYSAVPSSMCACPGTVVCLNTRESLCSGDVKSHSAPVAQRMWDSIVDGRSLRTPSSLCHFILLVYCDLKSYKYYYRIASPVLQPKEGVCIASSQSLLGLDPGACHVLESMLRERSGTPCCILMRNDSGWRSVALEEMKESIGWGHSEKEEVHVVFWDSCGIQEYPGWALRNMLVLVAYQFRRRNVSVLCMRSDSKSIKYDMSMRFDVLLPVVSSMDDVKVVHAWEALHVVDLGQSLDPKQLAVSAVDLNIQLMKWRALPSLDTKALSQKKCLLLGAGTLGCSVARALLGWGVQHITFVDNGRVSFSNPVRQSLFTYNDCLDGGRWKAEAAAAAVKDIHPCVRATGVRLDIPMPGHFVSEDETRENSKTLAALIEGHDVVFLLLDTREARWAPTVMGAAMNKITITAALGFDSYLVMRHGSSSPQKLGCYFCNDIVAPRNSTKDRSMDQQCTVARPGLSGICGSLAVELVTSILQHPLGYNAPASTSTEDEDGDASSPLGKVPHMIRGALTGFSQECFVGSAFELCPACGPRIISDYQSRKEEMILDAVNDVDYLERVSGLLDHVYREIAHAAPNVGDDDEDWTEL